MKNAIVVIATLSVTLLHPTTNLPSALVTAAVPTTHHTLLLSRPAPEIVAQRRLPDQITRREQFEAEYGIHPNDKTPVRQQIAQLKYGLDTATFGAAELLNNIGNALDFELEAGRWQHTEHSRAPTRAANPRVKVDVALNNARPYLGFRVIVPFGS